MSDPVVPPPRVQSPPPAPAPAVRTTSTLAVASLVSGLLGWSLLPLLGSVAAIITGHLARSEIRRNPAATEGEGLAIAGLVLGYAALGLAALGVFAVLLFFGGLAAFLALAGGLG